jgi:hypothetical protein
MARRRRLGRRLKLSLVVGFVLILAGGGGTAAALKVKHDKDVKAERQVRAEKVASIARDRRERELAAERDRKRKRDAKEALDRIELEGRKDLERSLEKAIKKDALQRVAEGVLDGPILNTSCDPVGGGRDDLTSRTGKYECIAATELHDDGSSRGYSFHGTINYKEFSYTWALGD